ncbi:MAG TPA: HD family phosphohydrolase [Desulfobulbaceae bacterium]|nr:MAG: HD family phosphohydrolase [Deltaproteobacteria bacterium RIFOXYD12_FULL_53_23]HCC55629.1 HD family phosphohydrolase [Desulfobulbaceae bacterium]
MDEQKRAQFKKVLREIKNLPTLPGIVAKLAKMAENPDTTTEQMGRLISKDHILASKLLKLVNSAFYGFPQRISSLNSAIILLGFNVIKSLIISASIFDVMEEQDVELWEHSLGCAVVSNVLARHLGVKDPEEISTAGLIHDLGKVAIKMELPKEYAMITELSQEKKISRLEAEREILGLDHAEVGSWLAKSWNLPNKLVEPIACHHDPQLAKEERVASAIVHFANIMIRGLGYGHAGDIWVPPLNNKAWKLLDLAPADIDPLLHEIEEKLWDVKGFSLDVQSVPEEAA